jgi:hypothetical protein
MSGALDSRRTRNCENFLLDTSTFDRASLARSERLTCRGKLMAFAYCLIAAGGVLTFSGLVAVAFARNELYSSAQI